jgi:hypothetical protein
MGRNVATARGVEFAARRLFGDDNGQMVDNPRPHDALVSALQILQGDRAPPLSAALAVFPP